MSRRVDGKVALVTGASRGVGRATALRLAREGAAVVVNYAQREKDARQVVDEVRAGGGEAFAAGADVGREAAVRSMVEQAVRRFGRIDILVNNAGISHPGNLLTLDEAALDEMIAVNIASIAGFGTALADTTPYAATKAAVITLTKRFALELGPHGITVNAISPGFIRTDMATAMAGGDTEAMLDAVARKAMLRRVGLPEDIAYAVLFLASDEASFISAQVLTVDGGRMDFLSHSG